MKVLLHRMYSEKILSIKAKYLKEIEDVLNNPTYYEREDVNENIISNIKYKLQLMNEEIDNYKRKLLIQRDFHYGTNKI